jgi:hypothetical protein
MQQQSDTWRAIAREAASAAEHIGIGATALSRANHAQNAYYSQAFFALSVGFERSCKLALSISSALAGKGFADRKTLKGYGHDIANLLDEVDSLAVSRGLEGTRRLPRSEIHLAVVDVLTQFASNITRYYNLESAAGEASAAAEDPISAWFNHVTLPVLAERDSEASQARRQKKAVMMRQFEAITLVRHHAEDGTPITSLEAGALHSGATEFARPWERMHVLQIARFLGGVLATLGVEAQKRKQPDVPYLSEFFAIYNNDDAFFRQRKTWSIYS